MYLPNSLLAKCLCLVILVSSSLAWGTPAKSKESPFKSISDDLLIEMFAAASIQDLQKYSAVDSRFRKVVKSDRFYHRALSNRSIYEILRSPLFRDMGVSEIQTVKGRIARLQQLLDLNTQFVQVRAGIFQMGSPADEKGQFADEIQHWVKLGAFRILPRVTQLLWYLVMADEKNQNGESLANPSTFDLACAEADHVVMPDKTSLCIRNPVESVSWDLVVKVFIPMVEKLAINVRLPTEAEWERATRGKDPSQAEFYLPFFFGLAGGQNAQLKKNVWYSENSDGQTQPMGEKGRNSLDLPDMAGNTFVWVQDWYGEYENAPSMNQPLLNPHGPAKGTLRVIRGCAWTSDPRGCRSAARDKRDAKFGYPDVGVALIYLQ